ncbi:hypothetical protein [Marivita sp.]|uniref:hypothetical protein n=1 Tax=Marivita sp. TaxID=2003365 RepID=UPI0025BA5B26|nr:hypothetical protein [Marivita sp.]
MRNDTRDRGASTRNLQVSIKHGTPVAVVCNSQASRRMEIMQRHGFELRRFETPDQRLDMKERGGISILQMVDSTGMHATFEPVGGRRKAASGLSGKLPNAAHSERVELILFASPKHAH